jgi:hypothetical protein
MSGALCDKVDFRYTCDVIAAFILLHLVLYFLVCNGFSSLLKSIRNTKLGWQGKLPSTDSGHKLLQDESGDETDDSNFGNSPKKGGINDDEEDNERATEDSSIRGYGINAE